MTVFLKEDVPAKVYDYLNSTCISESIVTVYIHRKVAWLENIKSIIQECGSLE